MDVIKIILFAIASIALLEGVFAMFFPKTIMKVFKAIKKEETVKKAGKYEFIAGIVLLIVCFNL
ncbi:MAG TPA: hypothetical protein PLK34_01810 [Candidatus Pacearchaeota archaeon]|nr:hypothetical protein [Candidatus Pacearchaeota archaeon]